MAKFVFAYHGGSIPEGEEACAIAAECPIIDDGGSVEAAPVMEM